MKQTIDKNLEKELNKIPKMQLTFAKNGFQLLSVIKIKPIPNHSLELIYFTFFNVMIIIKHAE